MRAVGGRNEVSWCVLKFMIPARRREAAKGFLCELPLRACRINQAENIKLGLELDMPEAGTEELPLLLL